MTSESRFRAGGLEVTARSEAGNTTIHVTHGTLAPAWPWLLAGAVLLALVVLVAVVR